MSKLIHFRLVFYSAFFFMVGIYFFQFHRVRRGVLEPAVVQYLYNSLNSASGVSIYKFANKDDFLRIYYASPKRGALEKTDLISEQVGALRKIVSSDTSFLYRNSDNTNCIPNYLVVIRDRGGKDVNVWISRKDKVFAVSGFGSMHLPDAWSDFIGNGFIAPR